jgi:serine/threonine-protein kinase
VVADRDPAPPEVTVVLPVPSFTNRSIDEARAVIEAAGWVVGDVTEERRDGTLRGQVLAVSPEPGTRLPLGGTVDLTVSAGQEIYPVPLDALADVTVEEATATLADAGFVANPDGGRDFHEDVAEGRVIGAVEGTGAEAERGSSIGLLVSRGPRPRTVPGDLVGGTETAAREALEAERLRMAEVRSFSDDVPEGRVISTLPRAGETVPRDSVVSVEISRGPELRAVPDVSGTSSIAEAVQVLRAAGFAAGEVRGPATGRPRRTSPAAGTMARPGSTVDIILG